MAATETTTADGATDGAAKDDGLAGLEAGTGAGRAWLARVQETGRLQGLSAG